MRTGFGGLLSKSFSILERIVVVETAGEFVMEMRSIAFSILERIVVVET